LLQQHQCIIVLRMLEIGCNHVFTALFSRLSCNNKRGMMKMVDGLLLVAAQKTDTYIYI